MKESHLSLNEQGMDSYDLRQIKVVRLAGEVVAIRRKMESGKGEKNERRKVDLRRKERKLAILSS